MIVLSILGLEVRKVRMSFKSEGQIRILNRIVKAVMCVILLSTISMAY